MPRNGHFKFLYGGIILAVLLLLTSCEKQSTWIPRNERLIILGFDGVDPGWMNRWMEEGKLPNLERLKNTGFYSELGSTIPPQSPVAWSTFATGLNPGGHGIYDFLKRNPENYMPDIAVMDLHPAELSLGLFVSEPAHGEMTRGGTSFWKVLADSGVKATLLTVPYTYPPEDISPGRMISGLGTPDLRGTNSTFIYMATDLTSDELGQSVGGGKLVKVNEINGIIATYLEAIVHPKTKERVKIPIGFSIRDDDTAEIHLDDRINLLQPGSWSDWMSFRAKVTPFMSVAGICRFFLFTTKPEFRIYVTPLCMDPTNPYMAFSHPHSFSEELYDKVGYFKTVGWLYDTSVLNEEYLSDEQWIEDMKSLTAERDRIFYSELEQGDWDLFIGAFTDTDRAAHMFYRFVDKQHPAYDPVEAAQYGYAFEWTYRHMDRFVGEVMDKYVDDRTTLIVMSDHGFHSYRRNFSTNTWLAQNGYLTFRGMEHLIPGQDIPEALYPEGEFFPKVLWNKTKAYSLGTGQIYINLMGRERNGIVRPGEEYNRLLDDMIAGLLDLRDPLNGQKVFSNVYKGKEVYSGDYVQLAPDLQLGFADGYRTSPKTMLGGIPPQLITHNLKKWSGDHSANAMEETPGILFSNRPILKREPNILDFAPSVIEFFGYPKLPAMEGSSFFKASE